HRQARSRTRIQSTTRGDRQMSATRSINPPAGLRLGRTGRDRRPGLGRPAAGELRKMVDTRSGCWVPIGVMLVTLIVAIIAAANHSGRDGTVAHVFHVATTPAIFLLPV